jgi:hypothetical protein
MNSREPENPRFFSDVLEVLLRGARHTAKGQSLDGHRRHWTLVIPVAESAEGI